MNILIKQLCDDGMQLVQLQNAIPAWGTFLTAKGQ